MILYTDKGDGKYRLIDYNESHSQLLFRKQILKPGEDIFNPYKTFIDVLFTGTSGINIKSSFEGIEISIVTKKAGQICYDAIWQTHFF